MSYLLYLFVFKVQVLLVSVSAAGGIVEFSCMLELQNLVCMVRDMLQFILFVGYVCVYMYKLY